MGSSTVDTNVSGKFEMVSGENYDAYLRECGVGMIQRTLVGKAKETITIAISGQQGEITFSIPIKTLTIRFSLGQEFSEDGLDERRTRSIIVVEGNKLIHTQRFEGSECTVVRVVNNTEMIATYTTKNVVATHTYKRIA